MSISKKIRYGSNALLLTFGILGIILSVNYFFTKHFIRLDLTENQQYSISEATKNTLTKLPDLVTIKVFFSEKLPPQFLTHAQTVHDILDEFEAYSGGNLQIQYIDPASNPGTQNDVKDLGIPEIKLNVLEKDAYQVQAAYLGIGIFYLDKHEILPVVQSTANLEYELLTSIKKVSTANLKTVGFVYGHGEHSVEDANPLTGGQLNAGDYSALKTELLKSYNVQSIDLNDENTLNSIDTLVVAGPKQSLSDYELFRLDQFVMNGKSVLFLIDTIDIGPGLQPSPIQSGIESVLQKYGLKVQQNLIIDAIHESATFSQGYFQFLLPYPFWVKGIPENFSRENPIVAHLESLVMTWISSLEIQDIDRTETEILVKSSLTAGEQKLGGNPPLNLDPNQQFAAPETKQYPLAVIRRGMFTSAYKGQDIPSGDSGSGSTATTISTSNTEAKFDESQGESTVFVIGDSDSFSDSIVQNFPQNLAFLLNVIDYTTLDKDLISIRSKNLIDRPLDEVSESQKALIKVIGIAFAPLLLVIYGSLRIYRRHKKKKRGHFETQHIEE